MDHLEHDEFDIIRKLPFPSPVHESEVKVKSLSRVQLLVTPWTAAHQAPLFMDFPGKSTGVGCHCLLRVSAATEFSKFAGLLSAAFSQHNL